MNTKTNSLRRALTLAAACLTLGTLGLSHARAQANLTFTGGEGTPLTITLDQPVTYVITTAVTAGSGPVFLFENVGDVFTFDTAGTGTLAFTLNAGTPQSLPFSRSDYTGGVQVPTDLEIASLSYDPVLAVGDVVTLQAGSLTTSYDFAGAPPASASYPTFIADFYGDRLTALDGVSAVPEPSTWALLAAGTGLLGLTLRRARLA